MTLILGIDLGTTKVTAIAVEAETGIVVAAATEGTRGNTTSLEDHQRGRSQWDACAMLESGVACLTGLVSQLGERSAKVVSLGVTGQQHGMCLIDSECHPVSPFINWQDQRGNELIPGEKVSWVQAARERLGEEAIQRTGCRLNTGFLATTLFWLNEQRQMPADTSACFLMDLFVAILTGESPVTDPTVAASAGVLNVVNRAWDDDAIGALNLRRELLPAVKEADLPAGRLSAEFSNATGIPAELPVSVPIGDHQASFLGSTSEIRNSVLLNVGTGAQVAVFSDGNDFAPPIELRPFPLHGNLLSNVGLTGGWSFQVVETFVRQLGAELFGADHETPVYEGLSRLAEMADSESGGLRCVPTFSGTRADPNQTGSFLGVTPENLTPANFARAVLAGMARNYREAWDQITAITGVHGALPKLAGAGNGLRENRVLTASVSETFGVAPAFTRHREEAAFGAALIGAVAAGVFDSLEAAGRLVHDE